MLRELHEELGIPVDYGTSGGPPAFDEAVELVDVGPNLVGRMQRLAPVAAEKWLAMVEAAAGDGVTLLIVSGFRSYQYQAALIRKKINAGQLVTDILQVNAAPGHS
jgi:D-alanyl-D-alanine carboxypeptidase